MAGTYKVKRISKILEAMTAEPTIAPPKPKVLPFNPSRPAKPLVDPGPKNAGQSKPAPVVVPTTPKTLPFNPTRPAKPAVDPGPKNYKDLINNVTNRYNDLIKRGFKPTSKK